MYRGPFKVRKKEEKLAYYSLERGDGHENTIFKKIIYFMCVGVSECMSMLPTMCK